MRTGSKAVWVHRSITKSELVWRTFSPVCQPAVSWLFIRPPSVPQSITSTLSHYLSHPSLTPITPTLVIVCVNPYKWHTVFQGNPDQLIDYRWNYDMKRFDTLKTNLYRSFIGWNWWLGRILDITVWWGKTSLNKRRWVGREIDHATIHFVFLLIDVQINKWMWSWRHIPDNNKRLCRSFWKWIYSHCLTWLSTLSAAYMLPLSDWLATLSAAYSAIVQTGLYAEDLWRTRLDFKYFDYPMFCVFAANQSSKWTSRLHVSIM